MQREPLLKIQPIGGQCYLDCKIEACLWPALKNIITTSLEKREGQMRSGINSTMKEDCFSLWGDIWMNISHVLHLCTRTDNTLSLTFLICIGISLPVSLLIASCRATSYTISNNGTYTVLLHILLLWAWNSNVISCTRRSDENEVACKPCKSYQIRDKKSFGQTDIVWQSGRPVEYVL